MTTSNDRPADARHQPVMLQRCLDLLGPALGAPGAVVVDCTLGLGGHAAALLAACPRARLIGLDRDPAALELARHRLAPYGERAELVHAVYDELPGVLDRLGSPRVAGILFDLGVSSLQLDEDERGFAYSRQAPLDMRMDQTRGPSAADVLNTYPPGELVRVLREYGEERHARRIVEQVVRERRREPIRTSDRLVSLIRQALPQAAMRTGGNPAKRTFQALRIEVNGELEVLRRAMPAAVAALAVGGRIVVLSYHSLEDRLVKRVLAAGAATAAPRGLPVVPEEYQPRLKLLTRGAELPDEEEVAANRRAAPARLRAAERIREAAS
ncbi:16S rRNA (cytosine(1402)-N(4))-methyltransferase RsmH [Streptomyces aidingensis]|uniref:Ribosomal RNA small subunit methyltransferase H n=1 Tax=Streptomyces aidingensis TaxID=910347 RepID=A0A1I1LQZ8_9ACTN|nr:16S rRNA (cytosine(1402)-N(4))-methyltransferase RsmH [Streptomyces aidingensis]SFC73358.1 16S rRNA (cytosine1402-N4)-methyltransferase [Streptomyces aidingensis]